MADPALATPPLEAVSRRRPTPTTWTQPSSFTPPSSTYRQSATKPVVMCPSVFAVQLITERTF
ncbi:MAG: hypothetical protein K8U57_02140 [Planctomycetes bacterium]|nr:hypothetical protein [Planctomycetota bacterium]